MKIEAMTVPDVLLITPRVFGDERGFFEQTWHEQQYHEAGMATRFVQDNWSRSTRGVLRGLHYQLRQAQAKLVYVIRGEVFDVAVDIRQGSPTFGQWVGAVLSEENHRQMFIPPGFAHGFCVLSDEVDFVYKCSDFYAPGDEYAVRWNDPELAIDWPGEAFIVSEKDRAAPLLRDLPKTNLPVME